MARASSGSACCGVRPFAAVKSSIAELVLLLALIEQAAIV